VQQSDIDSATASLQDQLTSAAQAGLKNLIHAGEQLFIDPNSGTGNGMQCTSSISPDHKANDRAPNVSVTGTATCKGEVYDAQAAQTMATNLLKSDAAAQLGMSYTLTGNVVAGDPTSTTSNQNGTISLNYAPQGLWVYQFNSGQKLLLAKLIVGKTQADTTALLLKQTGIQKARIQTSGGWGTALPTSPDSINISILSVPGL
jgi:hypothetical protein